MPIVTVHEAKTSLSELLRRVEAGEEIIIARGETPVAILKSYDHEDIARRRASAFGCLEGQFPPNPDSAFFDPLPDDLLAAFSGEEASPTDPLGLGRLSEANAADEQGKP
jgi:prevent-host-death family protein